MAWSKIYVRLPEEGRDARPQPVRIMDATGALIRMHYPEYTPPLTRCDSHGKIACPACTMAMGRQIGMGAGIDSDVVRSLAKRGWPAGENLRNRAGRFAGKKEAATA